MLLYRKRCWVITMQTNSLHPLLTYIKAAEARDAALAQVSDNSGDWMALALTQLDQLGKQRDGWANTEHGVTGEDIRPVCRRERPYETTRPSGRAVAYLTALR